MEDITPKDRSTLREYFRANAVPTQTQFWQFIESSLNPVEDGITKTNGSALSIRPANTPGRQVIELYKRFDDGAPTWTIELQPQAQGVDRPGLNFYRPGQNSTLYLRESDGNIGMGTVMPNARLQVTSQAPDSWHHDQLHSHVTLSLGTESPAHPASLKMFGSGANEYTFLRQAQGALMVDNTTGQFYFNRDNGVRQFNGESQPQTVIHIMNGEQDEAIRLHAGGASYFRGGFLGLGTTLPLAPLHIESPANASLEGGAGALLVGVGTEHHLAIDSDGIMAKSGAHSAGILNLQSQGGETNVGGDLRVHGNLHLQRDLNIHEDLVVDQNLNLGGTLQAPDSVVYVKELNVAEDASVGGSLSVAGDVRTTGLQVSGETQFAGASTFESEAMFQNGATLEGNTTTVRSLLRTQGVAEFANRAEFFEQVKINGDLQMQGPFYALGGAEFKRGATYNAQTPVSPQDPNSGTIKVRSEAGAQLSLDEANIQVMSSPNTIGILGLQPYGGEVRIGGELQVLGHTRVPQFTAGQAEIAMLSVLGEGVLPTLRVTGNAEIQQLSTTGQSTMETLLVTQNAYISNLAVTTNLDVSGALVAHNSPASIRDLTVTETANINNLTVGGSINVNGSASFMGPFFSANTTIEQLRVQGSSDIGSVMVRQRLDVEGESNFAHLLTQGISLRDQDQGRMSQLGYEQGQLTLLMDGTLTLRQQFGGDWMPLLRLGADFEQYSMGTGAGHFSLSTPDKPHAFRIDRQGKVSINHIGYDQRSDLLLKGRMDIIGEEAKIYNTREPWWGWGPGGADPNTAELVLSSKKSRVTIATEYPINHDYPGSLLEFALIEDPHGNLQESRVFAIEQLRNLPNNNGPQNFNPGPGTKLGFYLWNHDHANDFPTEQYGPDLLKRIPFCIDGAMFKVGVGTSEPQTRLEVVGQSNRQQIQMLLREAQPSILEDIFGSANHNWSWNQSYGGAAIGFASDILRPPMGWAPNNPDEVNNLMAKIGITRGIAPGSQFPLPDAFEISSLEELPIRMSIAHRPILTAHATMGGGESNIELGHEMAPTNLKVFGDVEIGEPGRPCNLRVYGSLQFDNQSGIIGDDFEEFTAPGNTNQWVPIWFRETELDGSAVEVEFFSMDSSRPCYLKTTSIVLSNAPFTDYWKLEGYQSNGNKAVMNFMNTPDRFHIIMLAGGRTYRWRSNKQVSMMEPSNMPSALPNPINTPNANWDKTLLDIDGGTIALP